MQNGYVRLSDWCRAVRCVKGKIPDIAEKREAERQKFKVRRRSAAVDSSFSSSVPGAASAANAANALRGHSVIVSESASQRASAAGKGKEHKNKRRKGVAQKCCIAGAKGRTITGQFHRSYPILLTFLIFRSF